MSQPTDTPRDEWDHAYERRSNETPSEAVIAAVAGSINQSPLEMEPLAKTIDPDALDRLFGTRDGTASSATLTFEYCGRRVTVTPDEVRVDL